MGLADDIINGNYNSKKNYKKKKESLADQIISGTYKPSSTTKNNTINTQSASQKNSSNNKTSLWDNIQNFASDTSKSFENLWLSLENGVRNYVQNVDRNATENRIKAINFADNLYEKIFNKNVKTDPFMILTKNANPQLSQENLKKETEERYEELQQKENENIVKMQENTQSIQNPVGKYIAGEMLPTIGQQLPGMIPGVGVEYFVNSASGSYYDDAIQRGMTEEQADNYAGIMGTIEGTLEAVGAGLSKGVYKKLLNKNIKGALVNYGLDVTENALEEAVVEPASEVMAGLTGGKDKTDWSNMWQRMLKSGFNGGVVSLVTGGASGAAGAIGSKISQKNSYVDYNTNEKLDKNTQNILKQAENKIQESNTSNLPSQSTQNAQNTPSQQKFMPMLQENVQNTNIKQNKIVPMQSYVYEKSDNTKIDNLRQDMSKYWDNSQQTINLGNTIEKIITDKNYNVRLDDTITNNKGQSVNAQIKTLDNGEIEIRINPSAKNTGEFLIMHETTHAIGTQEMKNLVMDYASKNSEFNQALESLKQTYGVEDVSDEVLSDISGQLFGNQEFIIDLSMEKPNVFKRIYNKIVELANRITGNSNEALFVKNLKNKWEEAYRTQNNNLDGNTYFSEIYNKDGSFDRVKIEENIFENSQGQSIKKTIKDYLTQHIGEYYNIIESGQKVYLGEDLPSEYAYSEYSKKLPTNKLLAKGRASSNLQEIIENASNRQWSKNTKPKHIQDAKYGFYKYDTKFSFDVNGKEQTYSGTILIRNDANGKKYLYDILNIKKIGNNLPSVASDLNKSSYRDGSNSLPTNSIPSSNENVNTTKYSMQESENNSGSFNLPKLKEGYTRLYRGLEKEYDANYDKTKLDNSNGYESWTDNYELAKAYGDNVYYIDVPTSEIKNSIIDEDSQSETYGDRNLLYKNDKPVGIKGKSGNEYMLYTDHDNYSNLKYNKAIGEFENNSVADIKNKYKDEVKYLILSENESTVSINNMIVKEDLRNKGIGQNILNDIIEYANKNNKTITLTPTSEFNTKDRLKKWYKKNGFVENKGKNTNFLISDTMYKLPNSNKKYSLPTKEWQQYLDENYKPTGTRTNLEDIRLPAKENSTKSSFNLPTNENDTDMIATILEKPAEKVKEKDRSWAIAKANLIDKGIVFEELSRKTGNRDLQGKWDYTLTSTARGQNAIGNARYELDPKTKTQKQISKSLTDIIDEVGENTADFYSYMYHQLNIDRMTLEERFGGDTGINYERKNPIMNKPVFGESVTAKMSRQQVAELEKKHPEFKEYAQDVYDYLDANTKELVDNGVISKETQQLFKDMYPHYVPISRVKNKGMAINVPLDTGRTGINSPIKKATGGSSDINPLFETMADRTLQTYRASARNSFGVELKNTLGKTNQILEKTDVDTIMGNMTDEEQNKQLLQEGKNGENPTFTVFENGNKVTYEISKDMYDALKPKNELLSKIDENTASKMANKINNFRRGLLTEYNPVFSITNAIKDSQDILLNSQHSVKTYAKIPEATAQLLSKGYWYNEYIQNGGAQNSYFKDGEFETTKNNLPTKIKNTITFPLRAISNINNVIEMTPRLAEYIVSREQGRSIETSMLDAARVTTNFKAGGDITKTLNRNGFTFLNASVQGMQQQIRNIQEANAKGLKGYAVLACKYAIAGAPILLLNNLLWADDDEYEELQDYVKDNYYIIGKLPNGKFLRIPKGRAVATIQKIVSNANEFIKNDSINSDEVGKVFWEDMKENIQFGIANLAPNNPMENNILSPIFQAITNKTWYGDDLVPTRLQNKPKAEQYDETTDSFSRWLGEKTGRSPIKINYLIDQYSGGVGDILLPLGTPQAENNVIEDKFTTDATMKSKYPGEFFAKVDELEINKNSSKATDEEFQLI